MASGHIGLWSPLAKNTSYFMMSPWHIVRLPSEVRVFCNGNIVIINYPNVTVIVPAHIIYSNISYALLNITHYDFEKQVNIYTKSNR